MDCLIHLMALCVFDPSNVYVKPGMDFALTGPKVAHVNTERVTSEGRWCSDHWCRGPMGILEIGSTVEVSRSLAFSYHVKHVSYIAESADKGENTFGVELMWRPFK